MDDPEARVLTSEFTILWIVGIYAPATGDEVRQARRISVWNPGLGSYLEKLRKTGKAVILVGDTNIAMEPIDITLPPSHTPPWLKPGEFICASKAEQESWRKSVIQNNFVDTF